MSPDVIKRCLKSVPLFAELPPGDLDSLAAASRGVRFAKGARIFEEGSAADGCFVLTAGRAQVVVSGNQGTEILLQILVPMGLVGEVALLDKSDRSASLVAAETCHLIRIPAAALETLRRNYAFEAKLVAGLAARLRESDDRVRVISTFPSLNRVAWCLGRVARYGGRRERATIVIPKIAHSELAEMAGCTRETVSRALQTLRKRHLVSWDEHSMRLEVEPMQRYLSAELRVPPESPLPW
jgi:CRP/FNR family transcriptional regulator